MLAGHGSRARKAFLAVRRHDDCRGGPGGTAAPGGQVREVVYDVFS